MIRISAGHHRHSVLIEGANNRDWHSATPREAARLRMIARGTGVQGKSRLLNIVTRLGRGDERLNEWEEEALRAALRRTLGQAREHPSPVLANVLPNLGNIANETEYQELSPDARDKLHQAGLAVRWTLNGLLDEYASPLDGETSKSVNLTGKFTSFDISQLPDDEPAVPVVMAIGTS